MSAGRGPEITPLQQRLALRMAMTDRNNRSLLPWQLDSTLPTIVGDSEEAAERLKRTIARREATKPQE